MPSRKKDRGKQRRARQKCNHEAARKESNAGGDQPLSFEEQGQRKLAANDIHRNCTADLREIVSKLSDPRSGALRDHLLAKSFHTTLPFFLGQYDQSVPAIVQNLSDADEGIEVPSLWMDILRLIIRHDGCPDDVLFEAAKSLGPVVEGITSSKTRELFQSNTIWYKCLQPFFELVHCIMKQSRRGFVEMLSYEGLLPFVAQASCWSVSRPDIVAEAGFLQPPDIFHRNVCHGAQQVIDTVIDAHDRMGGEGVLFPNPLEQIACAPLLGNDPECLDSTIVGLVDQMGNEHQDLDLIMSLIYTLLLDKDYVDAHVIEAVIDIGRRGSARFAMAMMRPILGLDFDEHVQPIDSRYAAAIRAGLLEVLTSNRVHDESNMEFAADDAYSIAKGIYAMAGHSKASRALRGRKDEILKALDVLRKSRSGPSDVFCSVIEDAVDFGTPICCNCLKTFDRNLLRFCQSCMIECYCSAACQEESWDAGHSHCCGGLKGEGRNAAELKRSNTLRQNVMMNGCRFVQRNIGVILGLAIREKRHMTVAVHFEEHPPRFERLNGSDEQRSVGVECVFISPVLYGFAVKNGEETIELKKVIPARVALLAAAAAGRTV